MKDTNTNYKQIFITKMLIQKNQTNKKNKTKQKKLY